jgi:dihydroorotate dehydrogenase
MSAQLPSIERDSKLPYAGASSALPGPMWSCRPWLWLPAAWSHALAPSLLPLATFFSPDLEELRWREFTWRGIKFRSPLGTAGGLDKDAESLDEWAALGSGFMEIGTITPRPQGPNPGRIVDRDVQAGALWNRMGFPSQGAQIAHRNLQDWSAAAGGPGERTTPVFVNAGKNRETSLDQASEDYVNVLRSFDDLADVFTVNISSPNTQGLRDLFQPRRLYDFLSPLREASRRPMLLKLSPDLDGESLASAVESIVKVGFDGVVATNTTLARPPEVNFPTEGGLSGAPLAKRSEATLREVLRLLGPAREGRLVVSAGGVMSVDDVFQRLDLGADLVQVYSTLVLNGPWLFSQTARRARQLAESSAK